MNGFTDFNEWAEYISDPANYQWGPDIEVERRAAQEYSEQTTVDLD